MMRAGGNHPRQHLQDLTRPIEGQTVAVDPSHSHDHGTLDLISLVFHCLVVFVELSSSMHFHEVILPFTLSFGGSHFSRTCEVVSCLNLQIGALVCDHEGP